jgi:hypothetical protein
MKIYINGVRASRADLERLAEEIKAGRTAATVKRTRAGAIAITTTF